MKKHKLQIRKAVLVYQTGIANVFAVESYNMIDSKRNAIRLFQGCFSGAVDFARGLATAGTAVKTAACNMVGDIAKQNWSENLEEQPFSDDFIVVDCNNTGYSD